MPGEGLGDRSDRRRQHPPEVRMTLREADPPPAGRGGRDHTGRRWRSARATATSQAPPASTSGPATITGFPRRVEPASEIGDRLRVTGGSAVVLRSIAARASSSSTSASQSSIGIETNVGPLGGSVARCVARASACGDVLGPRRLVAPLDERMRHPGRVAVGEVRLQRDQRADLVAGGDHERRVIRLGVEDRAHRVADAGRRVQVDQRRAAARLRVAVGHADDHRLLEPEDIREVVGIVLQHRQLGRAGVAEHRRHPVGAEDVEGGVADAGHQPDSMPPSGPPRRRLAAFLPGARLHRPV